MGRKPERSSEKKSKDVVLKLTNKGAWTAEEDRKLVNYVLENGDKKWRTLPSKAGLNRCGKSCRLRWLNYLRPGIKRGNISEDEEDLIIRLHNLLGNRWSLIAGRLPGRTDNEIKNHWNTHLSKKLLTISDLNTKFCTDNNGNSISEFSPSAEEEAPLPLLLPLPTAHLMSSNTGETDHEALIQQLQHEDQELEIGRLRVVGMEDDDQYTNANTTTDFETCHSPLGTWFQSFLGEFCSYNDLSTLLDYKDNCFLRFP